MKIHHRVLATIAILSTIVILPTIVQTQPPPKAKIAQKIRWKPPIPPSSIGIPGNRAQGGGTRGCKPYSGIAALVPLLPQNIAWGRTIANRPTVWLNIPQGLAKDLPIEIVVRSPNGKPIAKQLFTTKNKISSGTIGVTFPPATVMEIDRTYQWEIAFYCDTEDRIDRPLVIQGKIQRVAKPNSLSTAKFPLEVTQILAENGIWYDALTQLGERLTKTKDRDLSNAWLELLRSAGINGSDLIRDWSYLDKPSSRG
jgi:Domain of Unknown Function (DUF928)